MRRPLFPLLLLLISTLACGGSSTPTPIHPSPNENFQTSQRVFPMGVAGLIPANYPDSSEQDWLSFYEHLYETGEILGVYTAWTDSEAAEGEIPAVVDTAFGLAEVYGFTPLVALGTFRESDAGGVESTISWMDAEQVDRFRRVALSITTLYRPQYLALGVEVNRYYEHDPQGFNAFVEAYRDLYDEIKSTSPDTLVFTIFQLETLRGAGYLTGTSEGRQPHWELLELFESHLDLAVFTTYPYFDCTSPADIPEDYYTEIANHSNLPIAFSEIGWPSTPLSTAPDSAFGGSEEEQADFVRRFFELTATIHPGFMVWSFPHDIGPGINPAFESVSLRHNDGTPKPALEVWRSLVMQRRAP